jgi:two-component system response regulator DesR
MRVLLVEDDEVVHRALGFLIDLLPGCALVGVALTVGQALEAVARLRPDVVLMNADLPGALPAIGHLRAAGQSPADTAAKPLRIVLLSVYGRGERAARASGADAYLLKDCGPGALCAALRGESPGPRGGADTAPATWTPSVGCAPPAPDPERRAPWD